MITCSLQNFMNITDAYYVVLRSCSCLLPEHLVFRGFEHSQSSDSVRFNTIKGREQCFTCALAIN